MNRVPFKNQLECTLYVRPAKDHLLTSETPFAGSFEVPPNSTAWLWLDVKFESAGARVGNDGAILVETSAPIPEPAG